MTRKTVPANAKPPAFQMIATARTVPSPFNPRKTFDVAELQDLADSLKTVGLLEPVVVRPDPRGRPDWYELVVGERRWRAAKLAKLTHIPARVMELTDRQVLEAQFVEDLQRKDISDLERADGLHRLIAEHGATVEEIAQRIGKSVPTVRDLLRLRDIRGLPEPIYAALIEEEIPTSTLKAIARVPGAATREKVARRVLMGEEGMYGDVTAQVDDKELQLAREQGYAPLSYRQTKDLVQRLCAIELKRAPFSPKALDLVPAAGSCEACPKRAGNLAKEDPEYASVRADICTDPDCYRDKVQAHANQVANKHRDAGRPVMDGAEAAKVFSMWRPGEVDSRAWVDLGTNCYEDKQQRPWQKLIGKQLADQVTIAIDAEGTAHKLVPREAAEEVLARDHGIKQRRPASSSYDSGKWEREQEEREAIRAACREAAREANGQVAAAARIAFAGVLGWTPATLKTLKLVMGELLTSIQFQRIVERRFPDHPKFCQLHLAASSAAEKILAECSTGPELLALLAEMAAVGLSSSWDWHAPNKDQLAFWQHWKIDGAKAFKAAQAAGKRQAKEQRGAKKQEANGAAKNGKAPRAKRQPATAAGADEDESDDAEHDCAAFQGIFIGPQACAAHITTKQPDDDAEPVILTRTARLADTDIPIGPNALRALAAAGIETIRDLLGRAWADAKGPEAQRPFTLLRTVAGLDTATVNAIGDTLIDAGLVCTAEDAFPVGTRVIARQGPGTVTKVDPARTGKDPLFYVEADADGAHGGKAACWYSVDQLKLAPTEDGTRVMADTSQWTFISEDWRNITLTDLHLSAKVEAAMRKADRLCAGDVADWLDVAGHREPRLTADTRAKVRAALEIAKSTAAAPSPADTLAKRAAERKCRVCGCTDADCRQCIEATGHPCVWVEEDLCSRCADEDAAVGAEMEGANA